MISKTPKALLLLVILALAAAVVVGGCGGGSSSSGTTTEEAAAPAEGQEEAPAEETGEEPAEEKEEGGGNSALVAQGKTVFTTNCGSCHTLKAAGTTGTVGPNLDELEPDEGTVEHQVINGGGPMPAFGKEGILSSKEIEAVSAYVSTEAGK